MKNKNTKKKLDDEEELYDSNIYEAVKVKEGLLIKKKKKLSNGKTKK